MKESEERSSFFVVNNKLQPYKSIIIIIIQCLFQTHKVHIQALYTRTQKKKIYRNTVQQELFFS